MSILSLRLRSVSCADLFFHRVLLLIAAGLCNAMMPLLSVGAEIWRPRWHRHRQGLIRPAPGSYEYHLQTRDKSVANQIPGSWKGYNRRDRNASHQVLWF